MKRKLYFMVTFWGSEFREHFCNMLLPSLLAEGNIRSLDATLLIHTTRDDWLAICDREVVRAVPRREIVFIDGPGAKHFQHYVAENHLAQVKRIHAEGAVAGFLMPDMVLSEGLLSSAYKEIAESGRAIVLAPAFRYSSEKVLAAVQSGGFSRRSLAAAAAKALHPEISRYEYGSSEFGSYPLWVYWRVPERNGIVIHSVSWALVLADYQAIAKLDSASLGKDTIDGRFVGYNFGHLPDDQIALFANSDQGLILGLTSEVDPRFLVPLSMNRRLFRITDRLGLRMLRQRWHIARFPTLPEIDFWRARLYGIPATIHGEELDATYQECQTRASEIMTSLVGTHNGRTDRSYPR